MNCKEFVTKFNIAKDKDNFAKKHIIHSYIPYAEKLATAKKIAELSTHVTIGDKVIYKKSTPMQYFLKITRLVVLYTDIEFSEDINKDYDTLAEQGVLDILLSQIPESEITQFTTLVEMCVSDIYENERDLSAFLETKLESLSLVLNQITDTFKEVMENTDINQIKNEISNISVDDKNEVTENQTTGD